MFLIAPVDNNRWVYAMHGLEKPMDHMPGNNLSNVFRSIVRGYVSSSVEDRCLKIGKIYNKKIYNLFTARQILK